MTETLYKTGEVCGLMDLSTKTIQRYITSFPQAFTEKARQHAQGRRYTERDLKALFVIYSMRKKLKKRAEIEAVLYGDLDKQTLELFNVQSMMAVAIEASRQLGTIAKQTRKFKMWLKVIDGDSFAVRKRIIDINARLDKQDARMLELKSMIENALKIAEGKRVKKKWGVDWGKTVWDD